MVCLTLLQGLKAKMKTVVAMTTRSIESHYR